jgi:hypothetical protein
MHSSKDKTVHLNHGVIEGTPKPHIIGINTLSEGTVELLPMLLQHHPCFLRRTGGNTRHLWISIRRLSERPVDFNNIQMKFLLVKE